MRSPRLFSVQDVFVYPTFRCCPPDQLRSGETRQRLFAEQVIQTSLSPTTDSTDLKMSCLSDTEHFVNVSVRQQYGETGDVAEAQVVVAYTSPSM